MPAAIKNFFGKLTTLPFIFGILGINTLLFLIFITTKRYSPPLMFLHIVTIFLLWASVLRTIQLPYLLREKWKEVLLILGLILIGFFVRVHRVEEITPGMYGDEVTVARYGHGLLKQPDWLPFDGSYQDYTHPTPLMYLTAHSTQVFGRTITAIRLPTIVFGALTIGVFYILLRLFFPWQIATSGALLLIVQYTHLVLSRLAYEPIPSLFFQILTAIFLTAYARTKEHRYLIGIALSLGAGLYTYLNFRIFAIVICLSTSFLIWKFGKKSLQQSVVFVSILAISVMPLGASAIIDSAGFWGRVQTISIFSQGYKTSEFVKELGANMYRTAILPFYGNKYVPEDAPPFSGDPNPGKNPSNVAMFDPLVVLLALFGLSMLFRKKRSLFWAALLFLLPAYMSDIFSVEVIPEFHYYGLGHPNALRVSGFIPVILFLACSSLYFAYEKFGRKKPAEYISLLTVLVLCICFWNWHWYFAQKEREPNFYYYNYTYNNGKQLQVVNNISEIPAKNIAMTENLAKDENIQFFLEGKEIQEVTMVSTASALTAIKNNDLTVIEVSEEIIPLLNSLDVPLKNEYTFQVINNPLGQPETVLIKKNTIFPHYLP